ncbi:alanine racemase [Priestia taiwanensis]|uniref:Alanine racemase n=1 Tax=Priestia taiwanensis TaxID=1347902 RepID=A0A917AYQ6_9BACI|nr:alanine racemase [Priestia taiwanensis]MBM7365228.1 alanine racemase [Priestia taiwanensis]GGE85568.1 alanine racemase [Priestia taiwanensis]
MKQQTFYRDTWVEINLDCIYNNVVNIKRFIPNATEVIAVVKANAYGHGDVQVAKIALEAGATRLAVAMLDEALHLRRHGITAPIIVLGVVRPQDADIAAEHQIAVTVFRKGWLQEAEQSRMNDRPLHIHLKLDTGMGRLGIRTKEELIELLPFFHMPSFYIEGAYTHFAAADELNTVHVEGQYKKFLCMLDWLKEYDIQPPMIHCANSATSYRFSERVFNAVRIGIGMYGLTPSVEMNSLIPVDNKPAFSLHSRLTHIKKLNVGDTVSYGATYTAEEEEWIGTVAIGYADGWRRSLQGFHVLVDGEKVPIVGRVCMDQLMVRLPRYAPVDTEVILVGQQGEAEVTMEEVASYLDTINYEIPNMIGARVPRVFKRNDEIVEVMTRFSL